MKPWASSRTNCDFLAKGLGASLSTIKEILARDLRMRKLTRRWPPNKAKRVEDARTQLRVLRSDSDMNFALTTTGNQSWLCYDSEFSTRFAHGRNKIILKVSHARDSKQIMITICFTGTRLLGLVHLPQGQKRNKDYFVNERFKGTNG
jgi:hypothetical protein